MLADKVCGTTVGLWLLAAEHLRLGTWDLLCGWTGKTTDQVEPRLALQLVHEAALCTTGIRQRRSLSQKGFELVNGLPWLASDTAVHNLLNEHTVAEARQLQLTLGRLRRASGHFQGKLVVLDPHRVRSYSKRRIQQQCKDSKSKPMKMSQTFFALDGDTEQPICFTTATAARTVSRATQDLLSLADEILGVSDGESLVVADSEHYAAEVIDHVARKTPFDLLVPMRLGAPLRRQLESLPAEDFQRQWVGYATAKRSYAPVRCVGGPYWQFIQREGERAENYSYKSFLSTADSEIASSLCEKFPKRWHIEEFFNRDQSLGWHRAGTQNLHIRYGQMSLALIAQTSIDQLRRRLGTPYQGWDAEHLANSLFRGIDGDVRVQDETIMVTLYNVPEADRFRSEYESLPSRLESEGVDPRMPWLYNFRLDFRFR
jgi:hypothetical protein